MCSRQGATLDGDVPFALFKYPFTAVRGISVYEVLACGSMKLLALFDRTCGDTHLLTHC